jgi:hypothetical protein
LRQRGRMNCNQLVHFRLTQETLRRGRYLKPR